MEISDDYLENIFCEDDHTRLFSLSDGKLRSEDGRTFLIHKIVLAKNSKYFFALFCGMGRGKEDFLIPGIKGEILGNILSFIYTRSICVTDENILDLIIASDYLLLDELMSRLKEDLTRNLTPSNCLPIHVYAQSIQRDDISWQSFRFMQTHFEYVVHSEDSGICSLTFEDFKRLLYDISLFVMNEGTIWLAIVHWVEADTLHRLSYVPYLLLCLSGPDLDETIASQILKHNIVAENPLCQIIFESNVTTPRSSCLAVLKNYLLLNSFPSTFGFHKHRQAEKLHYIAYHTSINGSHCIQVYVTYDEKTDLWRKVLDIKNVPQFLLLVDECIYLFGVDGDKNFYFNILEKQWHEVSEFIIPRINFCVVELNGFIYILGGVSQISEEEMYDVQVYDYAEDVWFDTSQMMPVSSFLAVTHNISIYVVGNNFTFFGLEMVTQVYNQSSETWNAFPSPAVARFDFGMAVYHNEIFLIGGSNSDGYLKDVEVFDIADREWSKGTDLPFVYYKPRALVLHDNLIVCDNHQEDRNYLQTSPPVQWNHVTRSWKSLEGLSNLHRYHIFTVENSECINSISKQSKEVMSHFQKSHFA